MPILWFFAEAWGRYQLMSGGQNHYATTYTGTEK
jgi:hypothetical protein